MIKKNTTFTLVEMLVVVSVIMVLITILLPALSKSKKMATRTQCISNLRQIGVATGSYLGDFNNYFPAGQLPAQGGNMAVFWFDALNYDNMLALPWKTFRNGNTGLNEKCVGTVIHCPEKEVTNFYKGGYGKNITVAGGGNNLDKPDSLKTINRPAQRALVADGNNWCLNYWSYPTDITFKRHLGGNSFLFCDLHVSMIRANENAQRLWNGL